MSTMEISPSAAAFPWRKWLLRIHLWIGITFCIPFALLGITGSILVYDQDVLAPPRTTAVGEMAAPSAILQAAEAAHPDYNATQLLIPAKSGDPATVRLSRKGAERRGLGEQAYIDPVSLAVLGQLEPFRTPFIDFTHQLHGSLLLGGPTGRPIVGWLGVGMTILGLTGLFLWWPQNGRWRNAIGVSKGARGFLLHRQLHGTAGIIGWIVFVIVCFTGVTISFPYLFGPGFQTVFGGSPPESIPRVEAAAVPAVGPDRAAEIALRSVPNAHLSSLALPATATQPYRIQLVGNEDMVGAPVINVSVDPYKGEVSSVRDPRDFQLGDTLMAWQRTVHDGRAFGPPWAFLVCLIGLFPPLFAVTGTMMWSLRRRARLAQRTAPEAIAEGVPAE